MATNNAFTQQALASDPRFHLRLQNALGRVAWEVLEEDPATLNHAQRAGYAQQVTRNPGGTAQQLAPSFVDRPNVFQFETSYDFIVGATVTAAGDLDIESQLRTDWDRLSGVIV